MLVFRLQSQKRHGAILLHVLIFLVIISILLAGMAQLMLSDYSIVKVENDYSNSMVVAEAGINYELRKISTNATTADQKQATGPVGTSYTTAAGTFQVYVTQRNADGTEPTPWTPGNNLWIYATGGVNNLTRTVRAAAVPYTSAPTAYYGVFGDFDSGINGSATTVTGNLGMNGRLSFSGHPTVMGSILFNGPTAGWTSPTSGYTVPAAAAAAVVWPTVETIAVTTFGAQGLSYVAAHNDNLLASPPINSNFVSIGGNGSQTFVGKPGGANYYLTSLSCGGNSKVSFDNALGPINIWVGPSGAAGTFDMRGGAAAVSMTYDPTKAVRVYVATASDVGLGGNSEMDAGIYNINNSNVNNQPGVGQVVFHGTPDIHGSVIANKFTFNGNVNVTAVNGYYSPTANVLYYGLVPPWSEVGGVN